MLDICLLGTAGMMPLPQRYLTSMVARYNGVTLMVDCGEGTQVAMKEAKISPKPIDILLITHFHADHTSGIPGLLLTMGNAQKTSPLTIIGTKGIERICNSLRAIAPELPFPINYIELTEKNEKHVIKGFEITAFRAKHNITCYGYSIYIKRSGKFDVEKAKELNIPLKIWNSLQKGNRIELDGKTYTPDMVMGNDRKGIKVTYCTDSRPTDNIISAATDSDLFICEGMYGDPEDIRKARKYRHMTFYEAAEMGKKANVKEMWLTHFSPSLVTPKKYIRDAQKIFKKVSLGEDGRMKTFHFEE